MQDRKFTFYEKRLGVEYLKMIRALVNRGNKPWGKAIWLIWSWVVPVMILVVIAFKFSSDTTNFSMLVGLEIVNGFGIVFCLLLLPLNVGLESWKWQVILSPIQRTSLVDCMIIILSGKSLNVISPLGIGDAFSKYMGMDENHRKQIYSSLAIDRFSQLFPTLIFGTVAMIYLLDRGIAIPLDVFVLTFSMGMTLILAGSIFMYLFKSKVKEYLLLVREMNLWSALNIFSISVGRYLVFVLQFYLIFWWLGSELSFFTHLLGIAWIFLIKTLLPSLSVLGDLAKREVSAVMFFSFFTSELSVVLVASFVVWVINIALPALVGVYFVSDLKKSF